MILIIQFSKIEFLEQIEFRQLNSKIECLVKSGPKGM